MATYHSPWPLFSAIILVFSVLAIFAYAYDYDTLFRAALGGIMVPPSLLAIGYVTVGIRAWKKSRTGADSSDGGED